MPFAKKTRAWRSTLPTDGRGHLVFNVGDHMHIELGMPTPEDCREEELWDIETLMAAPPVALSQIGYAHRKNMNVRQADTAAGHRLRRSRKAGTY